MVWDNRGSFLAGGRVEYHGPLNARTSEDFKEMIILLEGKEKTKSWWGKREWSELQNLHFSSGA